MKTYRIRFNDRDTAARYCKDIAEQYLLNVSCDGTVVEFQCSEDLAAVIMHHLPSEDWTTQSSRY